MSYQLLEQEVQIPRYGYPIPFGVYSAEYYRCLCTIGLVVQRIVNKGRKDHTHWCLKFCHMIHMVWCDCCLDSLYLPLSLPLSHSLVSQLFCICHYPSPSSHCSCQFWGTHIIMTTCCVLGRARPSYVLFDWLIPHPVRRVTGLPKCQSECSLSLWPHTHWSAEFLAMIMNLNKLPWRLLFYIFIGQWWAEVIGPFSYIIHSGVYLIPFPMLFLSVV